MQVDHDETPMTTATAICLVYKKGGYSIEGSDQQVLATLFKDPIIAQAIRVGNGVREEEEEEFSMIRKWSPCGEPSDEDSDEEDVVQSFPIPSEAIMHVRQRAKELIGSPLYEEYDFKRDKQAKDIPNMYLKPTTVIRSYQSHALNEMLGSGRARSGMILLPCGAGKTLTGITAACTMRKSVLVLTTNAVSVRQWKEQFQHFTSIPQSHIFVFTADHKDKNIPENSILIATYQMIALGIERTTEGKEVMDIIMSRTWGLLLMDEAHVVPAPEYSRAIQSIKARSKLGLTATMVREDDKIDNLKMLIGPTLYSANWMDLTMQGYLANVKCIEAWCPMSQPFMQAYQSERNARRKMLFSGVNPNKLRAVELLVRYHERKGDKIIVFSDSIFTLRVIAKGLKRPYIYGQTKEWERQLCLDVFRRETNEIQTICLSKVGDVAIDLPKANVVIQVTSQFASRRQEAQRLGRILRPKFGSARKPSESAAMPHDQPLMPISTRW